MTEKERLREWVRWWEISSPGYQANALLAVLRNDGPGMLQKVLHEIGLESSSDLMREMDKRSK